MGQTVGAVLIERLLRWRILLLITSADPKVSRPEVLMQQVYIARLTQVIFREYWQKGRRWAFILLMTTFDDRDLQYLLIEDDEEARSMRLGVVSAGVGTGGYRRSGSGSSELSGGTSPRPTPTA